MSNDSRKITQWALEDRPREKMAAQGADKLTNAELMAILIGSGVPGTSAVELMRNILHDYNDSLKLLGRASIKDLKKYKGMGEAKAITVLAACQLAQRRLKEEAKAKQHIGNSRDIYEYFLPIMQDLPHEECYLMMLRQNLTLIGHVQLSKGGLANTSVDVRMLIKQAIMADSPVVALCHNHPSGSTRPSTHDNELTNKVKQACSMMCIKLLDHVIVTDGDYYSYMDNDRL